MHSWFLWTECRPVDFLGGEPERAPSNELLAKFTGGHLGPSSLVLLNLRDFPGRT